ncbi:MAG TPA: citramalate synthase [Candidatus Eisenbacteria bacterium]|nr:citramalate synthase [Candidatus Eisenbacteria bacterium]
MAAKKSVQLYDTTLRDGSQGEDISFSVQDKLLIARRLDDLGLHFIEGGWPGANPKDVQFFEEAKKLSLKNAKLVAFGSTRKAHTRAADDSNLRGLVEAGTSVITIFGKSWDMHVREVFKVELDENLRMISDSVKFLKSRGKEVIYDAEHFFDGYFANPAYALKTLKAAADAGASVLVLCDTNGGTMPSKLSRAVADVRKKLKTPVGIHTHNDCGMAVANAVAAVEAGATHVQGCMNGFGERTGNADILVAAANLQVKLGYACVPPQKLKDFTAAARYVNEVANMVPAKNQPYVGQSAFAHKGGVHIDAVKKNPQTYEHVDPAVVGNLRHHLVSEVGGRTNIMLKAQEFGIELKKDAPETKKILQEVQRLENEGWQFEGADASVELLIRNVTGGTKKFFQATAEIKNERIGDQDPNVEAVVTVELNGKKEKVQKTGDGPVDALGLALQDALAKFYPQVREVELDDYKVRIVNSKAGIAAKVRVVIEFHDKHRIWSTVGVSTNIIEASWQALVDAYRYKLSK